MNKKRLSELDRAKGLGIFLVVLGHVSTPTTPNVPEWYVLLRQAIYLFHMPFFIALAGMIFQYTYKPVEKFSEYVDFVRSKALRLIPAFFLFGLITMIGKMAVNNYFYVDNVVPANMLEGLVTMLVTPRISAAGSLWFIYCLFEFYLLFPVLLYVFRKNIWIILFVTSITYILPKYPYFLIERVMEFGLYFAMGMLIMTYYRHFVQIVQNYRWVFMILFIGMSAVAIIYPYADSKLVVSLSSIPALCALVANVAPKLSKILSMLGQYSFSIYLMNMIIIGLCKAATFIFAGANNYNFLLYFLFTLPIGLFGPVLIRKYVLSHVPVLDRLTA